jgi:hypothetical protein
MVTDIKMDPPNTIWGDVALDKANGLRFLFL